MSCNIVDNLHKMKVPLKIMEVMKIPQQKENWVKDLEEETLREGRIKEVVMAHKP